MNMPAADEAANSVASEKSHVAAAEYACGIVEEFFGETPKVCPLPVGGVVAHAAVNVMLVQEVCRLLFRHGPLSLRDVRILSGLPRSAIAKALMVLVQHGHVKALLHEQAGPGRAIIATTMYKVRADALDDALYISLVLL